VPPGLRDEMCPRKAAAVNLANIYTARLRPTIGGVDTNAAQTQQIGELRQLVRHCAARRRCVEFYGVAKANP
jgi:hypothetical protein